MSLKWTCTLHDNEIGTVIIYSKPENQMLETDVKDHDVSKVTTQIDKEGVYDVVMTLRIVEP